MMARNQNEELTVKGIRVDSINEYYVALGLEKMNLEFAYQVYMGGQGIRGSQIIDFLVYTDPKKTPLQVVGAYWHGGVRAADEALKEADINARMRGTWADVIMIYENECSTEEDAFNTLQEKLA
jgi:hypothetical protein